MLLVYCWMLIAARCYGDTSAPTFIHEPVSKVVFYNTSGTVVPCSAAGYPPPKVTWASRDGTPLRDIPGLRHIRADGSLVFPPFRAEEYRQDVHAIAYRCIATNALGTLGSRDVQVRGVVYQPFEVRVYDEFVIRGNTGVLRCQIPTYVLDYVSVSSWIRQDGFVVLPQLSAEQDQRYVVFPSGELHIKNVHRSDGQVTYHCQILDRLTGRSGMSITAGKLVVSEPQASVPPRLTHWSRQLTVDQGKTGILPCAAQGNPAPAYRWFKQTSGLLLPLESNERIVHLTGTLIIRHADVEDIGTYVCVVTNSVGEQRAITQLSVKAPLKVSVQPARQQVSIGNTASMNCSYSGHPVRGVVWLKDARPLVTGSRIKQNMNSQLVVTSVQREDKGIYQCLVLSDDDTAQGAAILSITSEPPVLVFKPEDQVVHPGTSVSLKCAATGDPLPQITWFSYGRFVQDTSIIRVGDYVSSDGIVTSFVNISRASVADGGNYECRATNELGEDSHMTKLNVAGPPFIRQLENVTVVAGNELRIDCPVGGYPIRQIYWEKGSRRLPLNRRQKVFANGTLVIQKVHRNDDEATYRCVVENEHGDVAERDVHVKILVAPSITPFSFPPGPQEGMRASVTCSVPIGDPPIRITWYKDGERLQSEIGVLQESVDDFISTLVFKYLRQDHGGVYTCVASNGAAAVNYSVALTVNAPPRWRIEPSDQSAAVGENLVIDCQAEGRPEPRVLWKKAKDARSNLYKTVVSGSRIQTMVNGSLVIQDVMQEDEGMYMCEASNEIVSPISSVIRVSVHIPAYFDKKFETTTTKRGSPFSLQCHAFGELPLTIIWMKDRRTLEQINQHRYVFREESAEEGLLSKLYVHNAERSDSGLFTCVVSNAYGRDEKHIELLVQDHPDSPSVLRARNVESRSLILSWEPPFNGNSAITEYIIEFRGETDEWASSKEMTVSGSQTEATISGLLPRKRYIFRISAANMIGKSPPGKELAVTTEEDAPKGPPRNVQVKPTSSRSLEVTWEAPAPSDIQGSIQGYYVGYKPYGTSDSFVFKTIDAEATEGKLKCAITGFSKASKYTIIVQAFNSKGAGPPSEEVVAQTADFDAPSSPTLRVLSRTSVSIQLIWELNEHEDNPIFGYILYYREKEDWSEVQVASDRNTHTFKDLQCGTTYQFYIIAYNSMGKGDPSDVIKVTTEGKVPRPPERDSLFTMNITFIIINLRAWQDDECAILSFGLQYRQQQQQEWIVVSNDISPIEEITIIRDLKPGMWYNVWMSARNGAGITEAEYLVATHTDDGGTISPEAVVPQNQASSFQTLSIVVPTSCALVVLLAVALAVFLIICHRRNREENRGIQEGAMSENHSKGESMVLSELEKGFESTQESSNYFPLPYATSRVPVLPSDEFRSIREGSRSLSRGASSGRADQHTYDVPQPRSESSTEERHNFAEAIYTERGFCESSSHYRSTNIDYEYAAGKRRSSSGSRMTEAEFRCQTYGEYHSYRQMSYIPLPSKLALLMLDYYRSSDV